MSETTTIGLPEAASQLGVPLRILRRAIRSGKIAAPAQLTATSPISADWLASAQASVEAALKTFSRAAAQKIPAFARYPGTSAWRKYHIRVREYAQFLAAANH